MKIITHIARIITGLLFVFSGFVKGIDPMGTSFKLGDYLAAAGLGFLDNLTLPLSILLCLIEFVTGMMLLTGSLVRLASWTAALFMAFFTPLTLVLAIFNPVSDCGCFGDAIHLTNWETFFKNIGITAVVTYVFIMRNDNTGVLSLKHGLNVTLVFIFIFILFMRYNLAYLPVIDFRPYRVGTNLPEAMSIPPDAPADRYDIKFIYEKDGLQKEFGLDNYPRDDTAWHFIDQRSVLVAKGYVPPLHDFRLVNENGTDMTNHVVSGDDYKILMISRSLSDANRKGLMKGLDLGVSLKREETAFYIVTSTPWDEAKNIVSGFNFLFSDETTLKTIMRSDPGFMLLHKGTVLAKWSYRGLPGKEKFTGNLEALALKEQTRRNTGLIIMCSVLVIAFTVAVTMPLRSGFSLREQK